MRSEMVLRYLDVDLKYQVIAEHYQWKAMNEQGYIDSLEEDVTPDNLAFINKLKDSRNKYLEEASFYNHMITHDNDRLCDIPNWMEMRKKRSQNLHIAYGVDKPELLS